MTRIGTLWTGADSEREKTDEVGLEVAVETPAWGGRSAGPAVGSCGLCGCSSSGKHEVPSMLCLVSAPETEAGETAEMFEICETPAAFESVNSCCAVVMVPALKTPLRWGNGGLCDGPRCDCCVRGCET